MKKILLILLATLPFFIKAQLPKPDHIVVVIFQNKGYSQIVGSSQAPFINSLLEDPNTAHFTRSHALTHPSQPNYLMLFSGSNQGVTTDNVPTNTPFHTCNMGASLLANGTSFIGYSESMPSAGYLGSSTTLYFRKHNPWADWQGTGSNTLPAKVNQPFSSFPSNYSELPAVSIVIPNIINCMHDGTIQQGDTWLQNNLGNYIQWAKTHNSLLILTFDEDNGNEQNRILTLFNGPMVKGGVYNNAINHYSILRTIEDIYKLPLCGESANAQPIDYVWKTSTGVKDNNEIINSVTVIQSSYNDQMIVTINTSVSTPGLEISLVDLLGKKIQKKRIDLETGENTTELNIEGLPAGIYFINIGGKDINYSKKILIN